jgi:hypothetical protein
MSKTSHQFLLKLTRSISIGIGTESENFFFNFGSINSLTNNKTVIPNSDNPSVTKFVLTSRLAIEIQVYKKYSLIKLRAL